jgi:subtilisin family serine protease
MIFGAGTLTAAIGLTLGGAAVSTPAQAAGPTISWTSRVSHWTSAGSPRRARPIAAKVSAAAVTSLPAALRGYLQDDRSDVQWSLAATHARQAWSATNGSGVVVATIDTGADGAAPDLSGRLLPGAHLDPARGTIVAGDRADLLGHGTHVAGVIVGNDDGHGITGVAPGAKVLPINMDTGDNVLSGKDVAAALRWAAAHGARVVNLSLGFSDLTSTAAVAARVSGKPKLSDRAVTVAVS